MKKVLFLSVALLGVSLWGSEEAASGYKHFPRPDIPEQPSFVLKELKAGALLQIHNEGYFHFFAFGSGIFKPRNEKLFPRVFEGLQADFDQVEHWLFGGAEAGQAGNPLSKKGCLMEIYRCCACFSNQPHFEFGDEQLRLEVRSLQARCSGFLPVPEARANAGKEYRRFCSENMSSALSLLISSIIQGSFDLGQEWEVGPFLSEVKEAMEKVFFAKAATAEVKDWVQINASALAKLRSRGAQYECFVGLKESIDSFFSSGFSSQLKTSIAEFESVIALRSAEKLQSIVSNNILSDSFCGIGLSGCSLSKEEEELVKLCARAVSIVPSDHGVIGEVKDFFQKRVGAESARALFFDELEHLLLTFTADSLMPGADEKK